MVSGKNKPNILIISGSNPYKISGVAAFDIFKGLQKRNFNVKILTKAFDKSYEKGIVSISNKYLHILNKLITILKRLFKLVNIHDKTKSIAKNPEYHVHRFDQTKITYSTKCIIRKINKVPDVIILLFIQEFLTFKNIYELQVWSNAKIYWQLPDMSPFTGLCHYSWDCRRYMEHCGKCPAIFSNVLDDYSSRNLAFKKHYAEKIDLRVLIGSDWLIKRAKKSLIFKGKKINKVFLSVDEDKFFPIFDRTALRKRYNIPDDAFVISFGAHGLNSKRKGIKYILEAIHHLGKQDINKIIYIIYIGNERVDIGSKFRHRYLGYVSRDRLPQFYQLSDVFVSASLQDVGPYTIVESLMCGVPVVSFETGFANDFVLNDRTGALIQDFSSKSLADGIMKMINTPLSDYDRIRTNAREYTKKLVSSERQISEYLNLFKKDNIIN